MILRRITEHVKAQNWTAVALDFFIVVVGVFIGIQVSNWNAKRVENKVADAYFVRLHADISNDAKTLKRRIQFWDEVIQHGETAIRFVESGEVSRDKNWEVFVAFYQASQLWKYAASDPTYEELKGGGQLALIRDDKLRAALVEYYESLDRSAEDLYSLNPEYRRIIREKSPYAAQTYIWGSCHHGDGTEQKLLDCPRPDMQLDITSVLQSFADDPRIVESLRFWIINLSITRDQGAKEVARLDALAEKLRQAWGKS